MSSHPNRAPAPSRFPPLIHRQLGREINWAHSIDKLTSEDDDAATYQHPASWDIVDDKTISTDGSLTFEWFGQIGKEFEFSTYIPPRREGLRDEELNEADRRYQSLRRQLNFACVAPELMVATLSRAIDMTDMGGNLPQGTSTCTPGSSMWRPIPEGMKVYFHYHPLELLKCTLFGCNCILLHALTEASVYFRLV